MEFWQTLLIGTYGIVALVGFINSFYECYKKRNSFGLTYINRIFGAFVFADMVVFGLFWVIVSVVTLFLQDFLLFLVIISLFWLIRSIGETMYWFNQQFSQINRNPIKHFPFLKKIFHNDSIWFVFQIFWQSMSVIWIVISLILINRWLS